MNKKTETLDCYLELERGPWTVAKARDVRAGGNNAEARLERAQAMERIDSLLDEYIVALGSTALADSKSV